jgi:RecB family endonuclease NucS
MAADVVSADKLGNIVIKIKVKRGAKQNAITGASHQSTRYLIHEP